MILRCGLCTLLSLVLASLAYSQEDAPKKKEGETPKKQRPGGGFGGGFGGGSFGAPSNPIMEALDADKNGEISAEELNNAVAALKKLDKDGDGKLSREEVRPAGGRGFGGGFGGGAGGTAAFVERIMSNDKNKDGKVTKDELPENMQRLLDRFDTNKDEAIDKEEAEKGAASFGGGRPGATFGGGRPGAAGGSGRPKRPAGDGAGKEAPQKE